MRDVSVLIELLHQKQLCLLTYTRSHNLSYSKVVYIFT
jgi:hypothetical protein